MVTDIIVQQDAADVDRQDVCKVVNSVRCSRSTFHDVLFQSYYYSQLVYLLDFDNICYNHVKHVASF